MTGRAVIPREAVATPTQIGRFVVLRKLGEGGMGVVYAAYDEELERKVAIKLLRGEFHGQRHSVGQARLQREAQAMARLSHPNIVQVYDVGKYGSGVFLAMEFVHGCDLREWQQRATRPWREVLAVYVQAGQGLAAAHAAGIVHRDFKPDNVLVGEDGRVRVVDFGLARPDEPTGDTPMPMPGTSASRMAVELTQAGTFIGTPAYMPPEQLRREPADARSDQFSFCVALYEGLYGHRPFPGADTATLKEAVLHDDPLDRPRDTAVPGWVHQALLRGLQREPDRRFRDMPGLLAALAADPSARRRRRLGIAGVVLASGLAAAGGGVAMYEYTAASATACSGGRERLAGVWDADVGAATRTALVGTGVGYAEDVATRVVGKLDAYAEGWVTMHREACETHLRGEQSDALFDARTACLDERRTALRALVEVLAQADVAVVEKAVQAADGLPSLARCADTQALVAQVPPPDDPAVARAALGLRERLARVVAKEAVGQTRAALTEAGQLRGEAEALGHAPVLAEILRTEGAAADVVGDYKTAEALLVRAIATADGAGDDDTRVAAAIDLVRVVGLHAARPEEGLRHAELVRGTLARLADAGAAEARLEGRVGEILLQRGDVDRAEPHIERAVDLNARIHGEASAPYAHAIDTRGTLRFLRGDLAGALVDYRRAVTLREEVYGAHHPQLATSLNNVGAVELTQFANDAAEATFRRAEAILRGAYGETHPSLGTIYSNVGIIAINQGRAAQAVEEFRRALAIYENHLPADHPTIGDCLIDLGSGLLYAGDHAAAEQAFARALAIAMKTFGDGHAKTTLALSGIGSAQLAAGAAEAAEKSFTRAVLEFRGAADAPDLGGAYVGLGRLHLARGQLVEAIERLEGGLDRQLRSPGTGPYHLAEARFLLAQALWRRDPVNAGRARALAAEARDTYRRIGAGFEREATAIEAWLAQLPPT